MTIAEPVWFRYAEWDYSNPSFPVLIGLRKDTPPEIVKQFKKDQRMYAEARRGGIEL